MLPGGWSLIPSLAAVESQVAWERTIRRVTRPAQFPATPQARSGSPASAPRSGTHAPGWVWQVIREVVPFSGVTADAGHRVSGDPGTTMAPGGRDGDPVDPPDPVLSHRQLSSATGAHSHKGLRGIRVD